MKTSLIIFCFIISSTLSFGQVSSNSADSIVKIYSKSLPSNKIYKSLLKRRIENGLDKRMDTTNFNYLYIVERFNSLDSGISNVEYYFNAKPESIYKNNFENKDILPNLVYQNGKLIDQRYLYFSSTTAGIIFSGIYEYYNTLDTILLRCKLLLPVQELSYDKTPAIPNFTNVYSNTEIDSSDIKRIKSEMKIIEMLKSTYQIITLVDKRNNKIIVSVQSPARSPEIYSYPFKFQYWDW